MPNPKSLILSLSGSRRAVLLIFGKIVALPPQRATKRDIKLLQPATGHQNREASPQRALDKRKTRGISIAVKGTLSLRGRLPIQGRINAFVSPPGTIKP